MNWITPLLAPIHLYPSLGIRTVVNASYQGTKRVDLSACGRCAQAVLYTSKSVLPPSVFEQEDVLAQIQDAEVWVGYTSEPGIQPMCLPKVFFRSSRMEAKALHAALIDRTPAIYTCLLHDTIILNAQCLQESEMDIVCDAIRIEVSK